MRAWRCVIITNQARVTYTKNYRANWRREKQIMPKLKPTSQWYCDRCGEIIESAEHGVLIFSAAEGNRRFFVNHRILHRWGHGPNGDNGCALDVDCDLDLIHYTKNPGYWLSHLHEGPLLQKDDTPKIALSEWAELYRRLYIPYYEEARRYFSQAEVDGRLDGMNEWTLVSPDILESIIDEYELE